MPTTSQGPLIVNDTAEVFFSFSTTTILSAPIITLVGVDLVWKFLTKVFIPFIRFLTHHLSAGRCTFSIKVLPNDVVPTLHFIVQWVYVVVTIEQTIQRNPVIRNGPRFPISFGQVCAFSSRLLC